MPGAARAIAFFDVDETLVSVKTMFDFYDYFLAARGHTAEEQRELRERARALLRPGLPREQGNRLFYQRFAGHQVGEVAEIGRQWFNHHLRRGGLFHHDVLDALHRHRAAGTVTALVSGSFHACLDPVAGYAGADVVLCTELEVSGAAYTGEVTRTMIGDAKAAAARQLIAEIGTSAARCSAYGDHISDLGLLELVGHPVVVGPNPDLAALAQRHEWARLPGVAA